MLLFYIGELSISFNRHTWLSLDCIQQIWHAIWHGNFIQYPKGALNIAHIAYNSNYMLGDSKIEIHVAIC